MTQATNTKADKPVQELAILSPIMYLTAAKVLRAFADGSDVANLTADQNGNLEMVADNLLDLVEIGLASLPDDDIHTATMTID
jgi:hypothetical protein